MSELFIQHDLINDRWLVRSNGEHESLTAAQLGEKYGIWNPIIYCQERREEMRKLAKGHAKPAGDVM